ncbi:hypothetical protein L1987_57393 [Smallanthus sonchifolius]|uniref:Uncharacterized protein n=1 Tax=Smallanthus sonchifolius TaxID=185202 RepID=A0ACB9DCH6_9ASTR|nr:hypothetical protein L1987_57393 [Smallanthus sonchifolius]
MEFHRFEAGNLTHQEYTSKFNEMGKLVPHIVTPESRRIKCYVQGLPPKVRTLVKTTARTTIDSAVQLSAHEIEVQKMDNKRSLEKTTYETTNNKIPRKEQGHFKNNCPKTPQAKTGGGSKGRIFILGGRREGEE